MTLKDEFSAVEKRRKTITVFAADRSENDDVLRQFDTRNVAIEHEPLPEDTPGFLVVAEDGEFLGSIGIDALSELNAPPTHASWDTDTDADADADFEQPNYRAVVKLLDDTLFTSYDRRQMLATTREFEDRAWRVGSGRLDVGFQNVSTMHAQEAVYRRLADSDLDIHLYGRPDWDHPDIPGVTFHTEDDEIGQIWFVVYDGGGDDNYKCALLAEEHAPGSFYGFWTYNPETVDRIGTHLRTAYN